MKSLIFLNLNHYKQIMPYNPIIHRRHSMRLKGYDYRLLAVFNYQAGLYGVMKEKIEKIEGK